MHNQRTSTGLPHAPQTLPRASERSHESAFSWKCSRYAPTLSAPRNSRVGVNAGCTRRVRKGYIVTAASSRPHCQLRKCFRALPEGTVVGLREILSGWRLTSILPDGLDPRLRSSPLCFTCSESVNQWTRPCITIVTSGSASQRPCQPYVTCFDMTTPIWILPRAF